MLNQRHRSSGVQCKNCQMVCCLSIPVHTAALCHHVIPVFLCFLPHQHSAGMSRQQQEQDAVARASIVADQLFSDMKSTECQFQLAKEAYSAALSERDRLKSVASHTHHRVRSGGSNASVASDMTDIISASDRQQIESATHVSQLLRILMCLYLGITIRFFLDMVHNEVTVFARNPKTSAFLRPTTLEHLAEYNKVGSPHHHSNGPCFFA